MIKQEKMAFRKKENLEELVGKATPWEQALQSFKSNPYDIDLYNSVAGMLAEKNPEFYTPEKLEAIKEVWGNNPTKLQAVLKEYASKHEGEIKEYVKKNLGAVFRKAGDRLAILIHMIPYLGTNKKLAEAKKEAEKVEAIAASGDEGSIEAYVNERVKKENPEDYPLFKQLYLSKSDFVKRIFQIYLNDAKSEVQKYFVDKKGKPLTGRMVSYIKETLQKAPENIKDGIYQGLARIATAKA